MKQKRRKFSAEFKAKVALEAIKGQKSLTQLAQEYEVNPVMISKWKSEFLANMAAVFSNGKVATNDHQEVRTDKLYAQIGQLKVGLDFLKKNAKKLGIPENEWSHKNQIGEAITSSSVRALMCEPKQAVLNTGVADYINYYNTKRVHHAAKQVPDKRYLKGLKNAA